MHFLQSLFSGDGFMPRAHCGQWPSALLWTNIAANVLTFAAYMAIPVMIGILLRRRGGHIALPWIGWLFVLFIAFCGLTHLNDVIVFWHPYYRFITFVDSLTALASVVTVVALWRVLPRLLLLRSPEELDAERILRRIAEAEVQRLVILYGLKGGTNADDKKTIDKKTIDKN